MYYKYQKSIESNIDSITSTVDSIIDNISGIVSNEDTFFDLRLILNELLINGYEHGNKKDEEKNLNIYLWIDESKVEIIVSDQGEGICYNKDTYDKLTLKTDGRGLRLVTSLADFVEIDSNKIKCRIDQNNNSC